MKTRERVERKLEASGRITPREVLEAYERTGLEPCIGWGDGRRTGCALTALLGGQEGYGSSEVRVAADELLYKRMPELWPEAAEDYRSGFTCGFDGGLSPGDAAYRRGWRDGRRARRFVFPDSP